MRPILFASLGLCALAMAPLGLASGCAAGSGREVANSTGGGSKATTSSGHGGHDGGTTGAAGHGGTGGTGGTAGTGGFGTGGMSTGGTGGADGGACKTGETRSCYAGNPVMIGVGVCVAGTQICQASGMYGPCEGEVLPSPELCDGLDNDCNGIVDDGCACKNGDTEPCYTGPPGTEGVGVCVGGTATCNLMGVYGACAGEVLPSPEVCDGLDNDCNGTKDEGLGSTTCGVGACQRVTQNCVGGVPQTCVPGLPVPEKCGNGIDDNCNGLVDENPPCACEDGQPPQSCYSGPPATRGVGACKDGTQICQGGNWLPCQGDVLPSPEVCNAVDDDCDGVVDDGLGSSVCGIGACQAQVQNCVAGVVQTCMPGQPSPEICDGIDNDCNGLVDDGLGNITCGIGACLNTVPFCKNGQPNVCNPLPPQVEICDGIDNNCNGVIDDGNPGGGAACTTGLLGVCAAGTVTCVSASLQCVENVQPSNEICDGKDNNCNGMVDEGNPGGGLNCNTGLLGACAAGTTACTAGSIVCNQNAQPSPEVCDGVDNNCNGAVDEGNPGGGVLCNTGKLGVCSAGSTACVGGSIVCNEQVPPSAETCDGLDNNCNGEVDEGNPGGGINCNTGKPGVCAPGVTACQNGAIVCNESVPPSAEICDGLDNNCNGAVDEGNPGGGLPCNTGKLGVCAAGTTACQSGQIVCVQNVLPSAETCDGLDNDCDGVVDNGDPGGDQACNTGKPGVCAAGTTACHNGAIVCNENVQPSPEICDGKDNNCDGLVDNGNPGGGVNCNTGGLGVCAAGITACQDGAIVCNQDVQPSPEVCDGLDNNCNGVVDEGDPGGNQACNTGKPGVCAAGTTACQSGAIVCNENVQPSPEICDGLDNNCNGAVDEGNPGGNQACNTGKQGVCAAGTTACHNGAIACNQNLQPSPEICDGLDNNCNGVADEGNPGGGVACNTGKLGVCAAGTTACQNGQIVCVQNVQPSAEICDGLDNDCNGVVDNGNPGGGAACNTGLLGVCAAGTTACSAGSIVCDENVQPSPQLCNGLDDNCNGVIDEGCSCLNGTTQPCYEGPPATNGVGACHGGLETCSGGAWGACVGEVLPVAETCDGIDNDCNGQVDDGLGTLSCGVGQCSRTVAACVNGHVNVCVPGNPVAEICDGLDNDCDGVVDNGDPGGNAACNTGKLGVCAAGTTACSAGAIVCNQNVQPSAEICDGLDNDCNGVVDNGNPGGGAYCSTGKLGVCAAGTTACSAGAVVCNQNVQPSAEICDGLDNNCNGQVDEGNPGGGANCNTGKPGICAAGTTACSAGAIACNQNQQPMAEICNGLDDDCNGVVDNGNPGGGANCNTGLLGVCAAGTTACSAGAIKCNENVQPSAEVCDGLDNNCNGQVDEGVTTTYYRDADGDGYGNPNVSVQACSQPAGYVANDSDCNDANAAVHPGATEICNGIDDNCNGQIDEGNPGGGIACSTGLSGVCAAGTTACSAGAIKCNENVAASAETCNGLDDDCDGLVDDNVVIPDGNPNNCAQAANKTVTVAAGGSGAVTGYIDPSGNDWFEFSFTGVGAAGTYYHPLITFTSNPGTQFKLLVYSACGTPATACSGSNLDTFEMTYPSDPNTCQTYSDCLDDTARITNFIVEVVRVAGAPYDCTPYTVTASNL